LPHVPQLFASVSVSTHWLVLPKGQYICGLFPELGQLQVPPEHDAPPTHTLPQAPQFAPSVPMVLMHVPLQLVVPIGQTHSPPTQL
jgi:hypothetical protein